MKAQSVIQNINNCGLEYLQSYLENGGDPNLHSHRWYLLHHCVSNFTVEYIKLLLDYKADIGCKTMSGLQPLHYTTVRLKNQFQNAQFLIKNGAEIDAIDFIEQRTPLATAIVNMNIECVELFLDAGAKISKIPPHTTIPPEVEQIFKRRHYIKCVVLVFICLGKRNQWLGKDVTRLIGLMIWQTRCDNRWAE
jgi:hypothetical protein